MIQSWSDKLVADVRNMEFDVVVVARGRCRVCTVQVGGGGWGVGVFTLALPAGGPSARKLWICEAKKGLNLGDDSGVVL